MRCLQPIDIHCKINGHSYRVPCGKCVACRKRKRAQWVYRLELEKRFGEFRNCWFVTLTYSPKYEKHWSGRVDRKSGEILNYVESDKYVLPSVDDLQAFFNRLRQTTRFRYLAVSQYGEEKDRAHYHLALFMNEDWLGSKSLIESAWSHHVSFSPKERLERLRYKRKHGFYPPSHPRELIGRVNIKTMSLRRFRYITKYILRHSSESQDFSPAELIVPNILLMSKGLGKNWLNTYEAVAIAKRNERLGYFTDGKPVALPKYFVNRIYTAEQFKAYQDMMDKIDLGPVLLSDSYTPEKYKEWYDAYQRYSQFSKDCFINNLFKSAIYGNF